MNVKEQLPLLEFEGYITYEYIVIRTLETLFDKNVNWHTILEFTMLAVTGKRDLDNAYITASCFVEFDSLSDKAIRDVIRFERELGTSVNN